MRSYRASTTANEISNVTADRSGSAVVIGDRSSPVPESFSAALSAAEQIVVDGLTAMWATRQGAGGPDRRALLASLTHRANGLTLRATIEAGRTGGVQGAIQGLVARRMRAAGGASKSAAGAA